MRSSKYLYWREASTRVKAGSRIPGMKYVIGLVSLPGAGRGPLIGDDNVVVLPTAAADCGCDQGVLASYFAQLLGKAAENLKIMTPAAVTSEKAVPVQS